MYYLLVICVKTLDILISIFQVLMLIRAILSWVPDSDNIFTNFVFSVTEPVITPVRMILEKFDFMQGLPIDVSFLFTYILLFVIQSVLPNV